MFSLLAQVASFFRSTPSAAEYLPASPAAALMECADVRAGTDARHAEELRIAASNWLSVVR